MSPTVCQHLLMTHSVTVSSVKCHGTCVNTSLWHTQWLCQVSSVTERVSTPPYSTLNDCVKCQVSSDSGLTRGCLHVFTEVVYMGALHYSSLGGTLGGYTGLRRFGYYTVITRRCKRVTEIWLLMRTRWQTVVTDVGLLHTDNIIIIIIIIIK